LIQIREYTSEDYQLIEQHVIDFCHENNADELTVLANINRGLTNISLAFKDGALVGLIGWIKASHAAIGEFFYVPKHLRGGRSAYKLLKHAESLAKFNKCEKSISIVGNERIRLYKRRGYAQTKTIMEKQL